MGLKRTNDELASVTDEIEREEQRHLDLEAPVTDEDGIVRDVPLLAGYIDPETGILHDTFSYREMDGKDEEAINKADARANSAKLANILCERCVIAVGTLTKKDFGNKWGNVIRSMLAGDIDYMMFKIRELSKGHEVTFTHKCPNCGTKLTTVMQTDEFEIKPFNGERDIPFELPRGYVDNKGVRHKTGVFHLPTGRDREVIIPMIKKNAATAMTALLTRCMEFEDGTTAVQSKVAEMVTRDRQVLQDILTEAAFGIDTTIEGLICENCGQDISGELGSSDFF